MDLYKEQFSQEHHFPAYNGDRKFLIIASTPRSGSHFLGHSLYSTKKFGFPLEYTNQNNLPIWMQLFNTDSIDDTLTSIIKHRTSENGVFGIKVHFAHIHQFGSFENLLHFFPDAHFVFLSRKDLLRQAISLVVARQTGKWIKFQIAVGSPSYDFDQINNALLDIISHNAAWQYYLSVNNCQRIDILYEDMIVDINETIQKIATFIGETNHLIPIESHKHDNKHTQIYDEWKNLYLHDYKLIQNKSRKSANSLISRFRQLLTK